MWKPLTQIPERRVPIIMKGDSGYIAPNEILYISGYYDFEYRPLSPWINSQGNCVEDYGLVVKWWMYISELEKAIEYFNLPYGN